MAFLPDYQIEQKIKQEKIVIEPYNPKLINPNSIDVTLHPKLLIYCDDVLDCKKKNSVKEIIIPEEGYILQPNQLYLGSTLEYTETLDTVPLLQGKSSLGRLGLFIHVTAGLGDVGFKGNWTLEMQVIKPLKVYPRMPIGQLCYMTLTNQPKITYDQKKTSKYNKQTEPTQSKMFLNFEQVNYSKKHPRSSGGFSEMLYYPNGDPKLPKGLIETGGFSEMLYYPNSDSKSSE